MSYSTTGIEAIKSGVTETPLRDPAKVIQGWQDVAGKSISNANGIQDLVNKQTTNTGAIQDQTLKSLEHAHQQMLGLLNLPPEERGPASYKLLDQGLKDGWITSKAAYDDAKARLPPIDAPPEVWTQHIFANATGTQKISEQIKQMQRPTSTVNNGGSTVFMSGPSEIDVAKNQGKPIPPQQLGYIDNTMTPAEKNDLSTQRDKLNQPVSGSRLQHGAIAPGTNGPPTFVPGNAPPPGQTPPPASGTGAPPIPTNPGGVVGGYSSSPPPASTGTSAPAPAPVAPPVRTASTAFDKPGTFDAGTITTNLQAQPNLEAKQKQYLATQEAINHPRTGLKPLIDTIVDMSDKMKQVTTGSAGGAIQTWRGVVTGIRGLLGSDVSDSEIDQGRYGTLVKDFANLGTRLGVSAKNVAEIENIFKGSPNEIIAKLAASGMLTEYAGKARLELLANKSVKDDVGGYDLQKRLDAVSNLDYRAFAIDTMTEDQYDRMISNFSTPEEAAKFQHSLTVAHEANFPMVPRKVEGAIRPENRRESDKLPPKPPVGKQSNLLTTPMTSIG